jgi:hypothetical protein
MCVCVPVYLCACLSVCALSVSVYWSVGVVSVAVRVCLCVRVCCTPTNSGVGSYAVTGVLGELHPRGKRLSRPGYFQNLEATVQFAAVQVEEPPLIGAEAADAETEAFVSELYKCVTHVRFRDEEDVVPLLDDPTCSSARCFKLNQV